MLVIIAVVAALVGYFVSVGLAVAWLLVALVALLVFNRPTRLP